MNQTKAFLRENWVPILVIVCLVTPAASWTWAIVKAVLGLVNWLGVLVVAVFFGARAIKNLR